MANYTIDKKDSLWQTTASKQGDYTFSTGGKYVDSDIKLHIPEANESVKNADGTTTTYSYTLEITDKGTTASDTVGVSGTENTTGYYPVSVSNLTGKLTAGRSGWFSYGSATDSSVIVGSIKKQTPAITDSATYSSSLESFSLTTTDKYINIYTGYQLSGKTYKIPKVDLTTANTLLGSSTVTTSADTGNMSTYFDTGGSDVTITPKYTITKGVTTTDVTTATSNGGVSSWTIKKSTITDKAGTVSGTTYTPRTYSATAAWLSSAINLSGVTFSNAVASGKAETDYTDISSTTAAPELTSGGYLYINAGVTSPVKISLAKLIGDTGLSAKASVSSKYILKGYTFLDKDGATVTGSASTVSLQKATATGSPTADLELAVGQYATISVSEGFVSSSSIVVKVKDASSVMDAATYNSNITFGSSDIFVPLVTTAGYASTNYIKSIKIGSGQTLSQVQAQNNSILGGISLSDSVTMGYIETVGTSGSTISEFTGSAPLTISHIGNSSTSPALNVYTSNADNTDTYDGVVNINGGNVDQGVRIEGKKAIVDTIQVTHEADDTSDAKAYKAGDLIETVPSITVSGTISTGISDTLTIINGTNDTTSYSTAVNLSTKDANSTQIEITPTASCTPTVAGTCPNDGWYKANGSVTLNKNNLTPDPAKKYLYVYTGAMTIE